MARQVCERTDVIPRLAEAFREHGYEGASLSIITAATGLGKGSLYHLFPGGKEEMAAVVLSEIHGWFDRHIFRPLHDDDPASAIDGMFNAVDGYFKSGGRVCLAGCFALSDTRDVFATEVNRYFAEWGQSLAAALVRRGMKARRARDTAEDIIGGIQGALVLSRAADDTAVFTRAIARMQVRLQDD